MVQSSFDQPLIAYKEYVIEETMALKEYYSMF